MNKKQLSFPIVLSILIVIVGSISVYFVHQHWSEESVTIKNTVANQVKETKRQTDLKSIIHDTQKSVVQIEALSDQAETIGSGFLYNNKGDIITNAHVVKNAETIYVKTANARSYPAALVGIGEQKDIAVIRVPQLANQTTMELDGEHSAEIGEEIVAVGSPLGFQNSVSLGIISGTNRNFSIDSFHYEGVYQISAQITHGNSGGPLIHRATGKIIGINSAGTENGGIGFSIPLQDVLDQARQWSKEADDKELNYQSAAETAQTIDYEQMEKDARYLIGYFFESLLIRDYLNAYKLFGSEKQTQTNYQDFREDYVHVVDINTKNMNSEVVEEEHVKITLSAANETRKSKQEKVVENYEYSFTIGYENDQLKVLSVNRKLTSSSDVKKADNPD